jgi:hypothetical protein
MARSPSSTKPFLFPHRGAALRSVDAIPVPVPDRVYERAWDHLEDELGRLALRLALQARAHGRQRQDGPLEAFKGLVISDEEVDGLLRELTAGAMPAHTDPRTAPWLQMLAQAGERIDARLAASAQTLPLQVLSQRFDLSPFEQQCLLIALAPELDLRYEKVFGYLQNDVTRRRPSVGFVLDLLCETREEAIAARHFFEPSATLFRHRLCRFVDAGADASFLARSIRPDERIVDFLLELARIDPRLDGIARLRLADEATGRVQVDAALCARLVEFIGARLPASLAGGTLAIHLKGTPGSGARALAEAACRERSVPLVVANLGRVPGGEEAFDDIAALVGLEAALRGAAVCIEGIDALLAEEARRSERVEGLLRRLAPLSPLIFFTGTTAWRPREPSDRLSFVTVDVPVPDARASRDLWATCLANEPGVAGDISAGDLSGRFRFGPAQMSDALLAAHDLAAWRSPRDPVVTAADLDRACREVTTPRLSSLARRVTPEASWDDLVLPPEALAQLHDICDHARHRQRVLGDWGFERKLPLGKGLGVLFSGPPGTGKTHAARVLAGELDLDLFQIDLSQVVSKYIGETEKNLRKVFDEADASRAILLFDEADALFGKRAEVKDAHDRYANIETGYLLQRMEEYESVAILCTNMRQNLDEAFVRRLRFIVEFPFPDEEQRRRIWGVSLPAQAPIAEDVNVALLARELKLAGGNIRNVALAGAFAAAADGGRITMSHLLTAAQREYRKLGRTWGGTKAEGRNA